jgi:hypothetical protein
MADPLKLNRTMADLLKLNRAMADHLKVNRMGLASGARMQQDVQKTIDSLRLALGSQAGLQKTIQGLTGQLATDDFHRKVRDVIDSTNIRAMAAASQPDLAKSFQQAGLKILPDSNLSVLSARIARPFKGTNLRIGDQIVQALGDVRRFAPAAGFEAATEWFQEEAQQAGDMPEDHPDESLGWWLATRPFEVQVGMLVAGLVVLDAFTKLLEEISGEDVPDPLQAATQLCFAVVAFLLLWMQERGKD